jgi:nicotinate-nucleotide adenylyltransferase
MLAPVRSGILGGTFDPIHIAHLHAAETARHAAGLDRVLFMPAGEPWQKADRVRASAEDRLEMARLAIEDVDGFDLDDREIVRAGPTYTIDTLLSFPYDEELFLILGADAAAGLPTWHRWTEVIDRAGILVLPRPGSDQSKVTDIVPAALLLDMAPLDISSTWIRESAAIGRPYRFLVRDEVYDYIESKGIYTQVRTGDRVRDANDQEEAQ